MFSVLPASISFRPSTAPRTPRVTFEFTIVGKTTRSGSQEAHIYGLFNESFRACGGVTVRPGLISDYVVNAFVPAVCRIVFQSPYGEGMREAVLRKYMASPNSYPLFSIKKTGAGMVLTANREECDKDSYYSGAYCQIVSLFLEFDLTYEVNGFNHREAFLDRERFRGFEPGHYYMTYDYEIVGLPRLNGEGLWEMAMAEGEKGRTWDDVGRPQGDKRRDEIWRDLGTIEDLRNIIRDARGQKVNYDGDYHERERGTLIKEEDSEVQERATERKHKSWLNLLVK